MVYGDDMTTTQQGAKMNTTSRDRVNTDVELKRADCLALNDVLLTTDHFGHPELVRVTSLHVVGDDVEVEGLSAFNDVVELTTSVGNTFFVVAR